GQILENAGGRVYLGEYVMTIRNDANIRLADRLDYLLQAFRSEEADRVLQAPISHRLHHMFEEAGRRTVDPELGCRNRPSEVGERIDCDIQAVSFDQGPVIHDYEGLGR